MPYYFMRDTPLQALEQLMMSQPGQKPRGGGIYRSPFHYTPKDVACEYCQNYVRKHPCRLCECTCLEERIEAGVLELNEFVRDCFAPSMGSQLRKRMHQQFREKKHRFFLSDAHRRRWTHWRERCWRLSDRNKAALFLLTAYEGLWRRMVWKCGNDGFDFQSVRLGGIEPELYSVYQAAKAIAVGCCNINGMKLEQVYDGQFFPCYYYEPNAITVAVTAKSEPEDTEHITWLYLPMAQEEIDRTLQRAGITAPLDIQLRLEDTQLPNEVDVLLDMEQESLAGLNVLAQATDELSSDDMKKLGAVVTLAKPQNAEQIKNLVENLDLFDFAPGAHTPEEYGKYMIQQSGHFDYDENLDEFYDYEKYGLQRMGEEDGMFTDRGYIAYKGYTSLAEIMDGSQSSHMEMGGMA